MWADHRSDNVVRRFYARHPVAERLEAWIGELNQIRLTEKKKSRMPPSFFFLRAAGCDALSIVLRQAGRIEEADRTDARAAEMRKLVNTRLSRLTNRNRVSREPQDASTVAPD